MRDREPAAVEFGEQRLDIAQDRFAGRRIADMSEGQIARQPLDGRAAREMVADQPEAAFGLETPAVERDDAGRFLAAMLQGVQAERGDRGGVGVTEDAEDAAFLTQPVAVEIVALRRRVIAGDGASRV